MERLKDRITHCLTTLSREKYGVEIPPPPLLYPPRTEFGDLASPLAFDLAKRLQQKPRPLAETLAEGLRALPGISRVEVAGSGYVNLFLDRPTYLRALAQEPPVVPRNRRVGKVVVEHTNINPNKAAHIGHLRNAALGDSLVRCQRFLGHQVEVQNYIDDTGVQVADLAIGITRLEQLDLEGVMALEARLAGEGVPLDHYCWDLYARVTEMYRKEPESKKWRDDALQEMEEGHSALAKIAAHLAGKIVICHLKTMARIGVRYDLLPKESDILAHRFWDRAFELLKNRGAVSLSREGKNAGCWVMDLSDHPEFANQEDGEKVLVRSNGTVTYVGKDIAYQLWKFGLLGSDFGYAPFWSYPDGKVLWATTSGGEDSHPSFGAAETIYNVIDVRQSYLQKVVVESLRRLGHRAEAERSIHFAYEMVALSPRCASEMGQTLSREDQSRSFVEMSGRKGLGVKADDLLDTLVRLAEKEVVSRNPELSPDRQKMVAQAIAVGSLRYYMLRYTRNKVIAFDFADALSFEGDTGPYVQYAVVRSGGILKKVAAESEGTAEGTSPDADTLDFSFLEGDEGDEQWELATYLGRMEGTVQQAVSGLELASLANYAFQLAQRFNVFYHKYPVLKETDSRRKEGRIFLIQLFRERMTRLLDLMGIPVPPLM